MRKNCGSRRRDTHNHHLDRCKFKEATGTQEGCSLRTKVANKRSSRKLENMVVSKVLPDSFTDEATKDQYLSNSSLQTANGTSVKKNLTFLTKFQNRIAGVKASEAFPCRNSFHRSFLSREMLVREYVRLARIIRRTAIVCFSPSSDADEDYLPYKQLDKMTSLSREAFGPLYLVT